MTRLSYVSGPSDAPLLGETIGDRFDRAVEEEPDREALVSAWQGRRFTYVALRKEVDRCARALAGLGLDRGDRLGIWAPNRWEWTVVQFATAKLGIILVNINPAYRPGELEYVLRQAGVRSLILAPRSRRVDYLELVHELLPALDDLPPRPDAVRDERLPELQHLMTLDGEGRAGYWCWEDLRGLAERVPEAELCRRQSTLQFDDAINIQYTSGTTGFPKGATLSHHNILNNAYFSGRRMAFTPDERLCIPVPLYHCFGMVLGNLVCVAHRATMVYPDELFDARSTLATVEAERCTALHGVPTMFIAELEHPEFERFDLSSLRTGIMAGSPCPIEVMREVQSRMHMREVEIGYGMTETSPISFQSRVDDPLGKRVSTVGRILDHTECKIVDTERGAIVPRGTPGELCTRGTCVMLGYWRDPEATAAAIDAARWMHSGDLATMDDEGYVNIVGRIKDMIVRGGENIYPREIEEFLHTHPEIADAYVIGVPDAKYGEEVMAWVQLRPGATLDAEGVREYCRGRIAHFKVPRYVKLVDGFPLTVTGKVRKFVMREQSIAELGLAAQQRVTA